MWFVLLLCVIAAFADVIGGLLTVLKPLKPNEMLIVTGLGTGFLLGATILDRLPDSISELPSTAPLYIIIGYLALLFFERFGAHKHTAVGDATLGSEEPFALASHSHAIPTLIHRRAALISFIGLLFHTFMDGVIIAGAFSISRATGILIFFAIAMHKIPEGFSMATISLASGASRKRALLTSTALAVSTMVGALVTLQVGEVDTDVVKILMALATGTFLFVSTTDMVPAIREQRSSAIVSVLVGVAIFYVSLLLIRQVGLT
jgi:zinc transporter ZupT